FNKFNDTELFPANYQKENESILSVTKGKQNKVEVATSEAISLPIEKGTKDKYELIYHIDQQHLNENNELEAPIKSGEKIETAELDTDEKVSYGSILHEDEKLKDEIVRITDVEKEKLNNLMVKY